MEWKSEEKLLSRLLRCNSCLEEVRILKLMKCQHSFCLPCLKSVSNKRSQTVTCCLCYEVWSSWQYGVRDSIYPVCVSDPKLLGVLLWQWYFSFVSEHVIFSLKGHCKILFSATFIFTFKPKILQSFNSSQLTTWFRRDSQKTSMPPIVHTKKFYTARGRKVRVFGGLNWLNAPMVLFTVVNKHLSYIY